MAFREVTGGNSIDIKQTPGQAYEGVYQNHREFDTQYGSQTVWNFRGKNGSFGIYGFTTLNRAMESVSEGSLCRITFTGKKKMTTKRGIVDVNTCRVEVDDAASADTDDMPDTYPPKPFDPDDDAFAQVVKNAKPTKQEEPF